MVKENALFWDIWQFWGWHHELLEKICLTCVRNCIFSGLANRYANRQQTANSKQKWQKETRRSEQVPTKPNKKTLFNLFWETRHPGVNDTGKHFEILFRRRIHRKSASEVNGKWIGLSNSILAKLICLTRGTLVEPQFAANFKQTTHPWELPRDVKRNKLAETQWDWPGGVRCFSGCWFQQNEKKKEKGKKFMAIFHTSPHFSQYNKFCALRRTWGSWFLKTRKYFFLHFALTKMVFFCILPPYILQLRWDENHE